MKKTVLYEHHIKLGAKMVEFAGYQMPIQYSSIIEEHEAVRKSAGVFDVSHMGEITVVGKEASKFLDYLFSNAIHSLTSNQIVYGFFLQDDGGVVDDLLVYKVNDEHYLLVVNAANTVKDYEWLKQHEAAFDVSIMNESKNYGELALQGPLAESILQHHTAYDLSTLTFFTFDEFDVDGNPFLVSRTGYTGEDGFEIYGEHELIKRLFKKLLISHDSLTPCGLGARDTLRFEVALPLYGHEISETITPLEAGYSFAVKFDKANFIGKEALLTQKANGVPRRLVGLEILDKGIVREGAEVFKDNKRVGFVTTGYKSPTLNKVLALALIDKPYHKRETILDVKVRKRMLQSKVIKKKLYNK